MKSDLEVAKDRNTRQKKLHELSDSDDEATRAAVALNPNTAKRTLNHLLEDHSTWVASLAEKQLGIEFSFPDIHPTAIISPTAKIGSEVKIGPFSVIHGNTIIGDRTVIGAYCEIGVSSPKELGPLIIEKESLIRSHSVFYTGSAFGERLTTGHRVTVRECTRAGKNLQIGTLSDIQGHCTIGDFVRLHSNVHIGQSATIGNFVWIFPYVVLTNDPHPPSDTKLGVTIKDFVAIATMSVILPGITVNEGVLIGAHSLINKDVPSNMVAMGSPAKHVCETSKIQLKDGRGPAYPWRQHFRRGYPDDVVREWIAEFGK